MKNMAVQNTIPGYLGDCALWVAREHPIRNYQPLLEMATDRAIQVIAVLDDMPWSQQELGNRLLITDFSTIRHELDGPNWHLLRRTKLLILDCPPQPQQLQYLLCSGASGALHPGTPIEVVVKAIKSLRNEELWFPRGLLSRYVTSLQSKEFEQTSTTLTPQMLHELSRREREVLYRLCSGASNEQIAEQLFISIHTVKSHVRQILRKTNTRNRLEVMKMILAQETDWRSLLSKKAA